MTLKIILADEHLAARLDRLNDLTLPAGFKVVGRANQLSQAVEFAYAADAELVLLSGALAKQKNSDETVDFRRRFPTIAVIVVVDNCETEAAAEAIRAGARGYVSRNAPSSELIKALRAVMSGRLFHGAKFVSVTNTSVKTARTETAT